MFAGARLAELRCSKASTRGDVKTTTSSPAVGGRGEGCAENTRNDHGNRTSRW
jgi:hypothetical protein